MPMGELKCLKCLKSRYDFSGLEILVHRGSPFSRFSPSPFLRFSVSLRHFDFKVLINQIILIKIRNQEARQIL